MPPLYDQDAGDDPNREPMQEILRTYLNKVGDPELAMQFLKRIVKTGKVTFDPVSKQLGIRGGMWTDPWDTLGQGDYTNEGLGTSEAFRQRFPGVGAYGESDAMSDVLGRNVFGDEEPYSPGRTLRPWELENIGPLQGGEYAPWEGTPYGQEDMNFAALRDPGLRETMMQFSAQARPQWDWEQGAERVPRVKELPRTERYVEGKGFRKGYGDEEGFLEPLSRVPLSEVMPKLQELLTQYGSVVGVAQAMADRHGGDPKSWARNLERILQGQTKSLDPDTADKIDVMLFQNQPQKPFDVPGFDLGNQPGGNVPGFGGQVPPQSLPGFTSGGIPPQALPGFSGSRRLNEPMQAVKAEDIPPNWLPYPDQPTWSGEWEGGMGGERAPREMESWPVQPRDLMGPNLNASRIPGEMGEWRARLQPGAYDVGGGEWYPSEPGDPAPPGPGSPIGSPDPRQIQWDQPYEPAPVAPDELNAVGLREAMAAIGAGTPFSGAPALFGDQGVFSYHPALDPRTWFQGAQEPTPQQSALPPGMTLSELLPLLLRVGI